jgi:hypothetical protein
MQQQQEQTKEQIIFTKSVKRGLDSKDREMIGLILDEEQTKQLIEELGKIQSRAKVQIHLYESTSNQGRKFDAGFFFVKEVQEAPTGAAPQRASGPATAGVSSASKAKIAALKKQG